MTEMKYIKINALKSSRAFKTLIYLFSAILIVSSCKHEPLIPLSTNVNNNGNDTTGVNGGNGLPCSPDSIYFQQQILPFLISSCAKIGCHDAITHAEGVVMDSYTNVMNTSNVTPFNVNNSQLYHVITDNDPGDRMPPPGENPLTQAQINLISEWISQGALNLVCDEDLGPCDSTSMSYLADVKPIIQNKCVGCHAAANSSNGFVNLSGYNGTHAIAVSGSLVGSITHNPSYSAMPKSGPMISNCEIGKIRNWVLEGALNN